MSGDGFYLNKESLYLAIDELRAALGIDSNSYPLNIVELCKNMHNIQIAYIDFSKFGAFGVRGLSTKVQNEDTCYIFLDSGKTFEENNYFCAHELVHVWTHPLECENTYDNQQLYINNFLEYHANEGAAEMVLPYREILPFFMWTTFKYVEDITEFKEYLSKTFQVPPAVVTFRLESLKWEIYQYTHGVSIDDLQIISKHQQDALKIRVSSLNDLEKKLPIRKYSQSFNSVMNYKSICR